METSSRSGAVLQFGPFELNAHTGELRKRGIRVALQEQPLRILAALLEQPGRIVAREDLCRRLWPAGTFVDFEHSLNAAVRRLRISLGDVAETPRFIETVPRRGYRFLASDGCAHAVGGHFIGTGPTSPVRLAVLPFVVLDSHERSSDFSEGLTEETVVQVARVAPPHVGVISRTAVMRLLAAGRNVATALETGQALDADYLLAGSIRSHGDRVRIVAQMIIVPQETHLWAATYDRTAADTLTLQVEVADDIARRVAMALSARPLALSREAAS
jgi:TolB-like protein/DNA-binding winged helix-turn-helix (wHTH) protein